MLSLGAVARRNPSGIALVDAATSITFAMLFDKSTALAAALELERDVESPIAFVARNDVATVALFFALLERGIQALPLNPRWTDAERRSLVLRVGARLVDPSSNGGTKVSLVSDGTLPPSVRDPQWATAHKPQLLIATSGSSGAPKLVCLSSAALEAAAKAAITHLCLSASDRWLLSLNLSHIGGIAILLRCLIGEATVVLAEPGMPPESMVLRIEQAKVTMASLVPTQLERLLQLTVREGQLGALRAVLLGGAHASGRLLQRARAAGWPVLATYGLSEAGSQVTTHPLTDLVVETPSEDAGVPLAGAELKLEAGVICIRGAVLFDGYWGESESPFDSEGWFHTGDLGSITDQGRLVPLGRRDDCIVTGGEKVSVLEVESALLDEPQILAAAVVAIADSTWGQIVAAAVVLDRDTDARALVRRTDSAIAARLAPHKRPRRWLVLGALPLLPGGKLDRPAVRSLFEAAGSGTAAEIVGFCVKAE